MNRREFVQASIAGAVAVGAAAAFESKEALPIIDTHQHLWDLRKFKLPWITKESPLNRSYLMADYFDATKGLNVVKTVYMEVAVDPSQHDQEAEYVLELCKKRASRMAAAVISGRPGSEGFKDYITKYKDNPFIKGVRQVLHETGTPPGTCLDKQFIQSIRLLGELGMSFDLCLRPGELTDATKLVDACSDTRFILDHCGNANVQQKDQSVWKKGIDGIARRKNVVCKISGIIASAKPQLWTVEDLAPIIEHTADVFGKDRIMFAGDWPVCTLVASFGQWLAALQSIVRGWKEEEQRKLFHDNAARFYQIR